MALLDSIAVLSILLAVIMVPFAIAGWVIILRGSSRDGFLVKSVVAFVALIVIGFLAGGISTYIGQYHLGEFLDSASPDCTVSIDGRAVPDAADMLAALRAVGDLPKHHSSPTRELEVVVSCPARQLTLWVARDSSDPHEYWVFFPSPSRLAYRARLKTDIGHVKTRAFDGYGT